MGLGSARIYFGYDFPRIKDESGIDRVERKVGYLNELKNDIFECDSFIVRVPKRHSFPNDIVYFFGDGEFRDDAVRYILSSKREFSPICVSCFDREYSFMERILKEERGEDSRLAPGILGRLFNLRDIEYEDAGEF